MAEDKQFPFITDGIRGEVPVNFFPASDSERGVILHPSPGLLEHCTLPDCTEIRGLHELGGYLYAVARRGSQSVLWRIDAAGAYSELGTIPTSASGPVWMVNNATQLLTVDGVSGYVLTTATGVFMQIVDTDFPGAGSCDYQDGYGLFSVPNTNRWFFSSLYDFLAFDALDFYSKERKPDNIVSLLSYLGEVWIYGESKGTEVWYNAGGDNLSASTPTFARNTGGLIEHGCGAAKSPNTFDGEGVTWLSHKGQLVQAQGFNAKVVSNQMFDRTVRGYAAYGDATAFSYRDQGHVFYQITFPAGDETWVLDGFTRVLFKKRSYKEAGGYGRHRANCYALMYNKHYVGDYTNGKIYKMSVDYYDDNGHEIQRMLYSKEIEGGLNKIYFPSAQIIVEPGVGLISGLDPQISLEFSNDGCKTWSTPQLRSAGEIGDYGARAIWRQLGSDYRRIYRLTFTDPVLWRVLGVDWGGER